MKHILLSILILLSCSCTMDAQKPEKAASPKTQCQAMTKKNARCKLEVIPGKKYCKVHAAKETTVVKCKATTKKGTRCTRPASKGGYCAQHAKMKKK